MRHYERLSKKCGPKIRFIFRAQKWGATGRYLECRSSGAVIAHLSCPREVVRAVRCHANATQARDLLPTARRWGQAPQTNPEGKRQGAPPEGTAAAALCRHSWVHGRPRNRKVGPKSEPVLGVGNRHRFRGHGLRSECLQRASFCTKRYARSHFDPPRCERREASFGSVI